MFSMFSNTLNTTSSTTNSTEIAPEMTENPFLKWIHIVSYSVICLIGVCGNFIVILASRKPDMITVSNVLIANLAVADFTVCLLNVPITAVYSYLGYWPFGAVLCKLIPLLLGLGLFASIGTLVVIAGERYWHIVLYTRRRLTIREAFKAITVIWVSALVFFLPMSMFYKLTLSKRGQTEVAYCIEEWPSYKSRQAFTALMFLLLYFFPLLLISGLYVKIGRFLRSLPATQQGNHRIQKKIIRMLFIVVLLFGLCWLPYHIVFLCIEFSRTLSQSTSPSLRHMVSFSQWLMFANSTCNPVVYAVLNKNYRRQFSMILCNFRQSVQVQPVPDPTQ